jgi:CheY-like chemotaxis protein
MQATYPKNVLFLDDDPDFLDTLQAIVPLCVGDRWQLLTARDSARALAMLRQHAVDLVVVDLAMPVVDGLQFLRLLHQVCPHPRKVVLSNTADERHRQACLGGGATLYLVKPASVEGYEPILKVLDEMLHWGPERGFSGLLPQVNLCDLVQLECMSRGSSLLQIVTHSERGAIYICEGRVIHAETASTLGPEAFIKLVSFPGGQFAIRPFHEPAAQTIHETCDSLLLAAAQRLDEDTDRLNTLPIPSTLHDGPSLSPALRPASDSIPAVEPRSASAPYAASASRPGVRPGFFRRLLLPARRGTAGSR